MAAEKGTPKTPGSGRKKGTRNKVVPEIRTLARQHGAEVIKKLLTLMRGSDVRLAKLERKIDKVPADSDEMGKLLNQLLALLTASNPANELGAAKELLDRGWGKAAQPHTGEDGEGPVVVKGVTVTYVDPDHRAGDTNGEGVQAPGGTE